MPTWMVVAILLVWVFPLTVAVLYLILQVARLQLVARAQVETLKTLAGAALPGLGMHISPASSDDTSTHGGGADGRINDTHTP